MTLSVSALRTNTGADAISSRAAALLEKEQASITTRQTRRCAFRNLLTDLETST